MFGATGYIGTYIIEQIVDNGPKFGRIAIFTSPSTVENKPKIINALKTAGVEVIVGDAGKEEDVVKALQGNYPTSPLSTTKLNFPQE